MAAFDNRHSRRVAFLKVVLPLTALAILSTLFLLADRRGTGEQLPYSQVELDRIVAEQRISNPNYSAMTREGDAITLAASSVRPDRTAGETMIADGLIGTIQSADGTRVDLSSGSGMFREGSDVALSGDVRIRSSAGYRVESERMRLDARSGTVAADAPVAATGPLGRLDAGGMTLERMADGLVLHFTGGVKLRYDPTADGGE